MPLSPLARLRRPPPKLIIHSAKPAEILLVLAKWTVS